MIARPLRIWKLPQNALYNCLRQVRYTQAMNIWLATIIYIMNSFYPTLTIYLKILSSLPQGLFQNTAERFLSQSEPGSQPGLLFLTSLVKVVRHKLWSSLCLLWFTLSLFLSKVIFFSMYRFVFSATIYRHHLSKSKTPFSSLLNNSFQVTSLLSFVYIWTKITNHINIEKH